MSVDSKEKLPLDRAEIERIIALNREDMERRAPFYREKKLRPWHMPYMWREVEQVVAALDGIEVPRVLTIGCGVGLVTPLVMERIDGTATAIDVSGKALQLFRDSLPESVRGRVLTVEVDAESYLSKTDETYHLIIYSGVLHHIPNYLDVLKLSSNVIAPGGVIFITKEPAPLVEQGPFGRWLQFVDGNINKQRSLLRDSVEESLRYNRRYLRKILPKRSSLYRRIDEEIRQRDFLHNEAEHHSEIDRPAVLNLLLDAGFDIVVEGSAQPVFNFHLSQRLADAVSSKVNTLLSFMIIAKKRDI